MVDSAKLKEKITEIGLTQEIVAGKMRMARCSLNQKINNKRPFKVAEAQQFGAILGVTDPAELAELFFAPAVADTQRNPEETVEP